MSEANDAARRYGDEGMAAPQHAPRSMAAPQRAPGNRAVGQNALLRAERVSFSYEKERPVLADVSLSVAPGTFLAVLGVNGCGKSTLLSCLGGLIAPQTGTVELCGKPIARMPRLERARRLAMVEQRNQPTRLTVYDTVLLGRKPHLAGSATARDHEVVRQVLADLRLDRLALRYVDELSGGEQQKAVLARALAQETDVLLLDEPTSSLDLTNQQDVMRIVRNAADRRGIAAVAVLHDLNLALRSCDRFLLLEAGRVYAQGGREVVTRESVRDVFGLDADVFERRGQTVVLPM